MTQRPKAQNPYITEAVQAVRSIRLDPQNEFLYMQRAATYAAIAQAMELEELGSLLNTLNVLIADQLNTDSLNDTLDSMKNEMMGMASSLDIIKQVVLERY